MTKPRYIILDSCAMSSLHLSGAEVYGRAYTMRRARSICRARGGACIFRNVRVILPKHFIDYEEPECLK